MQLMKRDNLGQGFERCLDDGGTRIGQQWDRCGMHYVEPIGGPAS